MTSATTMMQAACDGLLVAAGLTAAWIWLELAVLVALLGGVAIIGRLLSARAAGNRVRLTAQHDLHIVEVAGQRLLIGTGPGSAPSLIATLPAPAPAPAPTPAHESVASHRAPLAFATHLRALLGGARV